MTRRLFNLRTALSLLLCVAVVGLWVRSRFRADHVHLEFAAGAGSGAVTRYLFTEPGVLGYGWSIDRDHRGSGQWDLSYRESEPSWFHYSWLVPEVSEWVTLDSPHGTPPESVTYTVPSWMLVLALAARPAIVARRVLSKHGRRGAGVCQSCGYDLRATPGRCPECGTGRING
jgi:hypothetical protein